MITSQQRIRVDYAPLNIAVSLACKTPNSNTTQVYNSLTNEYDPDRSLSPTVVMPCIEVNAKDGTWDGQTPNENLANCKWFIDGVDITTIPAWQGFYEIVDSGTMKGAITISKNLEQGKSVALSFSADFVDPRTATNYKVISESISLSTTTKAEDKWHIDLRDSPIQMYNPIIDRLADWEYRNANGMTKEVATRAEAIDRNAYERLFQFSVFCGTKQKTSGYVMTYWRIEAGATMTPLTTDSDEVIAMTHNTIKLDLRMIESGEYLAIAAEEIAGETNPAKKYRFLAQRQFSVQRVLPDDDIDLNSVNATSLSENDTVRHDLAHMRIGDQILRNPERVFKLQWKTNSIGATGVIHNEGVRGLMRMKDARRGVGQDAWLDVIIDAEPKSRHFIATDSNGNIYTDSNGNEYIFN